MQAREPVTAQPKDWQLVLLGTGEPHLERELEFIERAMPGRAKGIAHFEEQLAHRLVAAADILVVPSRFEPCGIVALAALHYGTVPVVASVGGLRDIVTGRFLVVTDDKDVPQVRHHRFSM
jgi:glycogen synthase